MLEIGVAAVLCSMAVLTTVAGGYYLTLALLYFGIRERQLVPAQSRRRFAVIIPAHNEEDMLGSALAGWRLVSYPPELYKIYVVADNCTDRTADIARTNMAVCLERYEPEEWGKGYALAWAIRQLSHEEWDAVVFIDADCTVNEAFLEVMNARLAEGSQVIQAYDGVLNPEDTMLTRLMYITSVMKNLLFMSAKSKARLSVQLMGTGMCFERSVLEKMNWKSYSVGEDLEQSIFLTQHGIRVQFEPKAMVYALEASSLSQAYSQRVRWSSSRLQVMARGVKLLKRGLRDRSLYVADAGLSLLVPNYALLTNITLAGMIVSFFAPSRLREVFLPWFLFVFLALVIYLFMGMGVSKLSLRAIASLAYAPIFLAWKLWVDLVALLKGRRLTWIRTGRIPHVRSR